MPYALLDAHAKMLGRMEAEETLRMINAIGTGFGGGDEGKAYIRSLRELAYGDAPKPKPKYASPRQAAAAMGIPIVRERSAASS